MRDYFDWTSEAACNDPELDAEMFFKNRRDDDTYRATLFCKTHCSVRMDCLAHAIIYREAGVWGGFDELQRNRMRRIRPQLIELAKKARVFRPEFLRTNSAREYEE